ncbi:MAG: hypothetical protein ACXWCT_13015 [Flavitalea sp.]
MTRGIFRQVNTSYLKWIYTSGLLILVPVCLSAMVEKDNKNILRQRTDTSPIDEIIRVFYPVKDAQYSITICADVPVNDKPACVYKKGEPGHVFLILTRNDPETGEEISRSFGFYPWVPASCLVKQVRSKILENNGREYDAALQKQLSKDEFFIILEKCKEFARKKYNLKKYNCYDYALEVFNSLPFIEKLPTSKVKFPFILGRGGSPCGLFHDLKQLATTKSTLASLISFGRFTSPNNTPSLTSRH